MGKLMLRGLCPHPTPTMHMVFLFSDLIELGGLTRHGAGV